MASDFEDLFDDLADGENRLGELVRRVRASLSETLARAERLAGGFQPFAATGSLAERRRTGDFAPRAPIVSPDAAPRNAGPGASRDAVATANARANEQTARAVEELVRHGIRLRDVPPAVYAE